MQEESNDKTQQPNTLQNLWDHHAPAEMTAYDDTDDEYMWQQQDMIAQALPQDWHPSSPHSPVNHYMKDSIQKARELLTDRRNIVDKSHAYMAHASSIAFAVGSGLYCAGSIFSLPLIIGSTIVNFVNNKMTAKAHQKFDKAEAALKTCDDYERTLDDRKEAITHLRETAQHLYYWEKTSKVSSTVVKFALGEVIPMVGAVMSMMEVKDELVKKRKTRTPRTSYVFQDTVDIMQQNLAHHSTPDYKL